MFDKLRQSIGVPLGQSQIQQPNKSPVTLVSHIVHLAAAPPDGSLHPVWNVNSKFDQLTWTTLPDEFKQVSLPFSPPLWFLILSPTATDQLQCRDHPTYPSFQRNLPFRSSLFLILFRISHSLHSRQTPQMPLLLGLMSRRTTPSCCLAFPRKVRLL